MKVGVIRVGSYGTTEILDNTDRQTVRTAEISRQTGVRER